MSTEHISVMPKEVLKSFEDCSCALFVDGTTGAGGHAKLILEAHPEITKFIAIDQDPHALAIAKDRLYAWHSKISFVHHNFKHLASILAGSKVNGILLDLGVSSMQLDNSERGFSFTKAGPLDMRMNPEETLTAKDIVNTWSEEDLGYIFREYGEEKRWKLAAKVIITARMQQEISTTKQLCEVLSPYFKWNPKKGINPLTLIFQALRIAVNGELKLLEGALRAAVQALEPKGRLAVISFHSLEDRIVKRYFQYASDDKESSSGLQGIFLTKQPEVRPLTRRPLIPTAEEIAYNPRARSAKLRVIEKL